MPHDDDIVVTINDVRKAGFCVRQGVKPWMEERGVDFRDFLKNGMTIKRMTEIGDSQSAKVCDVARRRVAESDGR